jgi:NAD+ kinase
MRVAIFGRRVNKDVRPFIQDLFQLLIEHRIDFIVNELLKEKMRSDLLTDISTYHEHGVLGNEIDLMITMGGDGTFLDATKVVWQNEIPILGINLGRLGFLARNAKEDMRLIVELVAKRNWVRQPRSVIQVSANRDLWGEENYALNELTVNRTDSTAMITVHAYVNDKYLNSYWADGLIIATPTGSTGYSMSCGGPIVMPGSKNFVITPIAPHNLATRPLVLPDDVTLKLCVEGRSSRYLASLDSRTVKINKKDELTVRKGSFFIYLADLGQTDYLTTLRNKLLWGLDRRN